MPAVQGMKYKNSCLATSMRNENLCTICDCCEKDGWARGRMRGFCFN